MKITHAHKFNTPIGAIEFIPVANAGAYKYRLVWGQLVRKSWWKTPSVLMVRYAILRAAAKASGLSEYHYIDSKTEPKEWPQFLDFDGIHQP